MHRKTRATGQGTKRTANAQQTMCRTKRTSNAQQTMCRTKLTANDASSASAGAPTEPTSVGVSVLRLSDVSAAGVVGGAVTPAPPAPATATALASAPTHTTDAVSNAASPHPPTMPRTQHAMHGARAPVQRYATAANRGASGYHSDGASSPELRVYVRAPRPGPIRKRRRQRLTHARTADDGSDEGLENGGDVAWQPPRHPAAGETCATDQELLTRGPVVPMRRASPTLATEPATPGTIHQDTLDRPPRVPPAHGARKHPPATPSAAPRTATQTSPSAAAPPEVSTRTQVSGPTLRTHQALVQQHTPPAEVATFVKAIVRAIVPCALWGCNGNRRRVESAMDKFVRRTKYESFSVLLEPVSAA